ncbi:L-rhamnose ABC transporter [Klebsiella pneumoniae]|uniref:L-rhamnose ABC transporter n=1 Tax=Klebsiella pneumoniae TaxID=573 RepID=A0A2X3KJ39_KLEPN|nr:L-rhamnose ABC transporter [Klebsiella pneumoniae]
MSKMMVSEEMKTPRRAVAAAPPAVLGRVFTGGHPGGIYRQRRGFPVLPQYLEPVGRHLYFTEKAIVALPMAMLIIAREIDLSVASTMGSAQR